MFFAATLSILMIKLHVGAIAILIVTEFGFFSVRLVNGVIDIGLLLVLLTL